MTTQQEKDLAAELVDVAVRAKLARMLFGDLGDRFIALSDELTKRKSAAVTQATLYTLDSLIECMKSMP